MSARKATWPLSPYNSIEFVFSSAANEAEIEIFHEGLHKRKFCIDVFLN